MAVAGRDVPVGRGRAVLDHLHESLPVPPIVVPAVDGIVLNELDVQLLVRRDVVRELARNVGRVRLPEPDPDEIQEAVLVVHRGVAEVGVGVRPLV